MGGEFEKGQSSGISYPRRINRSIHVADMKTIAQSPLKKIEPKNDYTRDRLSYKVTEKKSKIDADLISSCIDKNSVLRNLRNNEKNDVISEMNLFHFKPYFTIYLMGSNAAYWYIVRKGDLEVYVDNKKIKTLKRGDSFGDAALINNSGQNGTVKTINDCELWGLRRDIFEKIRDNIIRQNYKENLDFLNTLTIPIKDSIKGDMANHLVKNIFKPNEVISNTGEMLSSIYIIKDGEVHFIKKRAIYKKYKRKEFFGEEGFFDGYRNSTDIITKTNCIIYTISYEYFYGVFGKGKQFKDQLYYTLLKNIFSKSATLNMIGSHLNENFDNFKFRTVKTYNIVYNKGTNLSKQLCVVLTGNIIEKGLTKFTKNDILYEKELLKDRQIILQNDLSSDSYCVIAEANFEEVNNDLEDDNHLNAKGFQYTSTFDNNNTNRLRLRSEVNLHNAMTMDRYPKKNYNFSAKNANTIDYNRESTNSSLNTRNRHINMSYNSNTNYRAMNNIGSVVRDKKRNPFSSAFTLNTDRREKKRYPLVTNYSINTDKRQKLINSAFGIITDKREKPVYIKREKRPIFIKREIKNNPLNVLNKDRKTNPFSTNNNDKGQKSYFAYNRDKRDSLFKNNYAIIAKNNKSIITITKEKPNNKIYNSVIGFNSNTKEANFKYTKTVDDYSQKKRDKIKMISIEPNKNNLPAYNRVFTSAEEKKKIMSVQNVNDIDKIKVFRRLDIPKKNMLQSCLKVEKFTGGNNILLQGEKNDKLYIVKNGTVEVYLDTKYIKSKTEGEFFGYDTLIASNTKCLETVRAKGQVDCYTLNRDNFNKILNKDLKDYFLNQYYLNDYSIELGDLEYVKMLGEGSYGFVNLVSNKRNKHLYAAKALYLTQIKEENILSRTECERNLLLKMDHPFIAKCVKSIKHDVYLLYIMEYVQGKELFDVMREINLFDKAQTQFYAASMLEVINYLHRNKIIYRDLKPENIMIKEDGYIKFIDFGTVKEIRDKTKTFIGTYSYMAPEVFTGLGYSFPVDIWSLGIIMYEFLCGKLPFGEDFDDEDEPMKFYNVLKVEKLVFPSFIKDEDFKDLIQKILVMDPNKRLTQYSKIRDHPYFKGFDWQKLDSLELRAPYNFKLNKKINMTKTKPYLDYLTGLGRKPYFKKLASIRQLKFQEWYDNF